MQSDWVSYLECWMDVWSIYGIWWQNWLQYTLWLWAHHKLAKKILYGGAFHQQKPENHNEENLSLTLILRVFWMLLDRGRGGFECTCIFQNNNTVNFLWNKMCFFLIFESYIWISNSQVNSKYSFRPLFACTGWVKKNDR